MRETDYQSILQISTYELMSCLTTTDKKGFTDILNDIIKFGLYKN